MHAFSVIALGSAVAGDRAGVPARVPARVPVRGAAGEQAAAVAEGQAPIPARVLEGTAFVQNAARRFPTSSASAAWTRSARIAVRK